MEMPGFWRIFVGLIVSAISVGVISYGRKMEDYKFVMIGVLMFALTYIISSPLLLAIISTGLTAVLFNERIYWWLIKYNERKSLE